MRVVSEQQGADRRNRSVMISISTLCCDLDDVWNVVAYSRPFLHSLGFLPSRSFSSAADVLLILGKHGTFYRPIFAAAFLHTFMQDRHLQNDDF